MKTFWVSLAASAVVSAVTAVAVLLAVGGGDDSPGVPAATVSAAVELAGAREGDAGRGAELGAGGGGAAAGGSGNAAAGAGAAPAGDGDAAAAGVEAFSAAAVFDAVAGAVVSVETDFGAGSGFFVDEEGYIVTNLHVVEESGRIWVWTNSGERAVASLEGTDWGNDLAVLKVDPEGLTFEPAVLGDGSVLDVGQEVAAIGAPSGRTLSLTTGVVSGLDRQRARDGRTAHQLIQSDAAINPGSSGGVLANGEGEVIGVTSLIDSPVGGFTGIGYSVSVETLKRVLERMIAGEDVSHPRLGVVLTSGEGELRVTRVSEGDAAEAAGVEEDDVIVSLGGTATGDFGSLVAVLETLRSGEETVIVVERDGERVSLEIELRAWEREQPQRNSRRFFTVPFP